MRESNRTNVSAIALFTQSLDKYEETIQPGGLDPILYVEPTKYLQMALNRLITANVPDAFQMMRCLANRMNLYKTGAYSEYTILMIASGSASNISKDEVMVIIHTLLRIMRGEEVDLGFMWMSRINSNAGIAEFMKNYATSDQMSVAGSYKGNVVLVGSSEGMIYVDAKEGLVPLGKTDKELTLTATEIQTVRFSADSPLVTEVDYRSDLPTVISSSVSIRADLGRFYIAKTASFTPTAKAIVTALGCEAFTGTLGGDIAIQLPGPFFTCKLDVASFDSGTTWVIGNVQIIPPSLRG